MTAFCSAETTGKGFADQLANLKTRLDDLEKSGMLVKSDSVRMKVPLVNPNNKSAVINLKEELYSLASCNPENLESVSVLTKRIEDMDLQLKEKYKDSPKESYDQRYRFSVNVLLAGYLDIVTNTTALDTAFRMTRRKDNYENDIANLTVSIKGQDKKNSNDILQSLQIGKEKTDKDEADAVGNNFIDKDVKFTVAHTYLDTMNKWLKSDQIQDLNQTSSGTTAPSAKTEEFASYKSDSIPEQYLVIGALAAAGAGFAGYRYFNAPKAKLAATGGSGFGAGALVGYGLAQRKYQSLLANIKSSTERYGSGLKSANEPLVNSVKYAAESVGQAVDSTYVKIASNEATRITKEAGLKAADIEQGANVQIADIKAVQAKAIKEVQQEVDIYTKRKLTISNQMKGASPDKLQSLSDDLKRENEAERWRKLISARALN